MDAYLKVVKSLTTQFDFFELTRIPRGENTLADALAALASTSDPDLKRIIPVETIKKPSIAITVNTVMTIEGGIGEEIFNYISTDEVPSDKQARWKGSTKATHEDIPSPSK